MPAPEIARMEEFTALLRDRLPDKTLRHSLSVAEFMASVAERAGVEHERAVTAGLLHDLCKTMKPDALLERARAYGLEISELQQKKPNLLHGPVAAEETRRVLGVADDEVYDAIRWHTTGRPKWGRLGMALYIADFSEPLRDFPEADEARRILLEHGFDAALCYVAEERWKHVQTLPHVDPTTKAFVSWLHSDNGCCP